MHQVSLPFEAGSFLVGGAEASQNGLGEVIPAKFMERSGMAIRNIRHAELVEAFLPFRRIGNPDDVVEMLRQAQHDVLFEGISWLLGQVSVNAPSRHFGLGGGVHYLGTAVAGVAGGEVLRVGGLAHGIGHDAAAVI